ncbi:MAG: hypothetical protein AB8B72_08240 [Crocinitomicaceae bacterium]
MKKIILVIPTFVFMLSLLIGPTVSFVLNFDNQYYASPVVFLLLDVFQWFVIAVWMISLVQYFSYEAKTNRNNVFIYLLLFICALASIWIDNYMFSYVLLSILMVSYTALTVLITLKVKSVFYARSAWFVFLEILFVFIGFLTLTPQVKDWEASDKV